MGQNSKNIGLGNKEDIMVSHQKKRKEVTQHQNFKKNKNKEDLSSEIEDSSTTKNIFAPKIATIHAAIEEC